MNPLLALIARLFFEVVQNGWRFDNMKCAVFLDRDDTIIVDKGYLKNPDGIEFLPGIFNGLQFLQNAGYSLIQVSNQSGIGRGYFTEEDYFAVTKRLNDLLNINGITFTGYYYCPHAPNVNCKCRKPKPYLAQKAAIDFDIDLKNSYMVGDKPSDIEFGKNFGAKGCFYSVEELVKYLKEISQPGVLA